MYKLQDRRNRIIDVVVSTFLETGKPVSSGHVSKVCGIGLSPATIRNCMMELEGEGFLTQPHTSAGRIPTVKGYRFYVKNLMPHINLAQQDYLTNQAAC